MKSEKGITLLVLMITVVILSILAGVSISAGIASSRDMLEKNKQSELNMVQHAILEQYQKYKVTNDTSEIIGDPVSKSTVDSSLPATVTKPTKADGYFSLVPEQLKQIGIKRAKDTYFVNYETGMVYNKTARTTTSGEALYLPENI